ncbi:hypothetical protein ACH5RR_011452 [Cinchona calisaya]|uniref:Filament-like plant protein 7 n=1 Tax=Cinchona calisaya TaxID=153742 RepID=A0ABD3A7F2_9GENT
MDNKSWLWMKRSTEKTIISDDKTNPSSSRNEDETLLKDKAQLERDLRSLNVKLSSAVSEFNSKDDFAKKQATIAQEAISGWEKTETEALSLKQELEKALQQRAASEERLVHLDAALKECMQQLQFVREEQEKRIHDAVGKTSKEFESARITLDQMLVETKKRLDKVEGENNQLSKALLAKEMVIEESNKHRAQMEANFGSLLSRLESRERENASLTYEVRVLEKELEIRNEEREFNRRTSDVAHKQHLESVKKIAKLESECQRLRLLVQKKLPGPAALAKMKNEVEMLGRDQPESRRRKSIPSPVSSMEFSVDAAPDDPQKRINFLTQQLCFMEEENKTLKEAVNKRITHFQSSTLMYTQTASRLSQLQGQLGDCVTAEPGKDRHPMRQLSLASMSDTGSDDKASCAESWASALVSELEQYTNGKHLGTPSSKVVGASDMSLMYDFVEMEKLAVVPADNPLGDGNHIARDDETRAPLSTQSSEHGLEPASTAVIPEYPPSKKCSQKLQLSKSIHKIIDLIEGINIPALDDGSAEMLSRKDDRVLQYKNSETPTGYTGRVFQWKASELSTTFKQFVQTCNDLLNGKSDIESFAEQLACTLEWIMNHCFSLQDVQSMKDTIRSYFDWDESRSESEVDNGTTTHVSESNKWTVQRGEVEPIIKEVHGRLKEDLPNNKYAEYVLEGRLQSEVLKSESLIIQPQESHKTIKSLQMEVETLEQVNEKTYHHNEKHFEAKDELTEACKMYMEKELDNKKDSCKKLDGTCHDLQLPLESKGEKGTPVDMADTERELQTDWEIVAASEKLAKCQETILNLGKQLKALASPMEAALFDKVISSPARTVVATTATPEKNRHRFSLLDKMLAEDKCEIEDLKSPKTKEIILDGNSYSASGPNKNMEPPDNGVNHPKNDAAISSMAIVPGKKRGRGGLLKKLWQRRKKGSCKK